MGFIKTGNTLAITAYLTQVGRNHLLNGTTSDITVKYFSLGDSDSNYMVDLRNPEGYIPDLSGDSTDCILSLANNVGIKHNLSYAMVDAQPKEEVWIKKIDGTYTNVLDCFINLDSIGRYMMYHSCDNFGNADGLKVKNDLLPIFTDLFRQVDLLDKPSANPLPENIQELNGFEYDLMFDPNIFKSLFNTYIVGDNTYTQTGQLKSPIQLTFSSRSGFTGAGNVSVGIMGRELGYIYKTMTDNRYQFYNASETEGILDYKFVVDENNQILNNFTDFTLGVVLSTKNKITGSDEQIMVRGDRNLTNLSVGNLSGLSNEVKNANQHLKLFKRTGANALSNAPSTLIINGYAEQSGIFSPANDNLGIIQKEILNLKNYVEISPVFGQTSSASKEYRTSKLTFNIYPKGNRNVLPATLNLVFKFNEDVLLDGDVNYSNISDEGDKSFVSNEFLVTNFVYKNVAKTQEFIPSCPNGQVGSPYNYTVPKAKYTGSTQVDADNLAQLEINQSGQTAANTFGTCITKTLYKSQAFGGYITKSDCDYTTYGSTNYITLEEGAATSENSQMEADMFAMIIAQEMANGMGYCIPYYNGGGGGGYLPEPSCLLSGERVYINSKFDVESVENLRVGDYVYTAHEFTKKLGLYKITHAETSEVDKWLYFITEDGYTVRCSETHLFMVNDVKTIANTLKIGDNLMVVAYDGFITSTIKDIIEVNEKVNIHKIEVEDAHTYITENNIWHHNRKVNYDEYQLINDTQTNYIM